MRSRSKNRIDIMQSASLLLLTTLLGSLGYSAQHNSGIFNGKEAAPHSKPYMVSIQAMNFHLCGGFLVSRFFVMTAAHCFKWGHNLTAVLGAHNLMHSENAARIPVKFYHIYPGFNLNTLENDIMLLQLETPAQESKTIQSIPIPKQDEQVKARSTCNVAGWGLTEDGGHRQACLREANVTTVSQKDCKKDWGSISEGKLCAGGNIDRRGFCQGDSGGPLVCKKKAVGIVSFFEWGKCSTPTKPNVYTQVSKYASWINIIMKNVQQ